MSEIVAGPADCCEHCHSVLEWEDCWFCLGEGDFHDCGEDSCCCLYPDVNDRVPCEYCDGNEGWLVCPNRECNEREAEGAEQ